MEKIKWTSRREGFFIKRISRRTATILGIQSIATDGLPYVRPSMVCYIRSYGDWMSISKKQARRLVFIHTEVGNSSLDKVLPDR